VRALDPERDFYVGVLGMRVIAQTPEMVLLGAGTDSELALQKGTRRATGQPEVHFGFKVGSAAEVNLWEEHLRRADVCDLSVVDSDDGRAVYFRDPEGYRLEIYWYASGGQ
jgi:catechol-2,3-dioxygenase